MTAPADLFDLDLPGGDYDALHVLQDPGSGLRAIIAIHDTRLGPAAGGIRRTHYPTQGAALADALGLARAMTIKCALAELPAGGGKTVILDHDKLDVPRAYQALGQTIEDLDGAYLCGPDVGTGEAELRHVRERTQHVNPAGNQPHQATARGVLAALGGLARVLDEPTSLAEATVLIQGLGGVGLRVATALSETGATVLGTDVDEKARERAREAGVDLVEPNQALTTPCDVLVPCAIGGLINEKEARELDVAGICGPANNQLAAPEAGRTLHDRGIRFVPDTMASAGAVIEGVLTTREGATQAVRAKAGQRIDAIEDRVVDVLEASLREDRPPAEVAHQRALALLGQS